MGRKVIGICGEARHGKDTAAGFLLKYGFKRYAFADKLKEMVYLINPIIGLLPEFDGTKVTRLAEAVDKIGWDRAKSHPEVRVLLQRAGTEAGRNVFGVDCWIKLLDEACAHEELVVISDARFPNEGEWINSVGGEVWKVHRPDFDNGVDSTHASESQLKLIKHDRLLVNDGTMQDLERLVEEALHRSQIA